MSIWDLFTWPWRKPPAFKTVHLAQQYAYGEWSYRDKPTSTATTATTGTTSCYVWNAAGTQQNRHCRRCGRFVSFKAVTCKKGHTL